MIYPGFKSVHVRLLLLAIAMISMGCNNGKAVNIVETDLVEEPVDSIALLLEQMTLQEKVGQMFLVHPEELSPASPTIQIDSTMVARIKICPVGGIVLFGANIKAPEQISKFTSDFRGLCKYPPFIGVDEEGGTVARIGRNTNFDVERIPAMIEIGKTGDTIKAYNVGATIGEYLMRYGINLDFAPVADVFSNPANKVIGGRAFGRTPQEVTPMVHACAEGMRQQGVCVTLKHFPGHGDTETDSHSSLPHVTKTWAQLMQCEIIPFKENFDIADMIMIAHIAVNEVNEEIEGKIAPSTLSYNMLTGKLRNELGYEGIIITDALRMKAVTEYYDNQGEAAVQAVKAGVDIIMCPSKLMAEDGPYFSIINAVRNGDIPEERIDESVYRIMTLKSHLKD